MIRKRVTIQNKSGLHARPAAHLVKIAGRFNSDIKILKDGLEVNAKSILGVMMLAAETGSELEFVVDGEDEQDALNALEELVEKKFYEE